MNSSSRAIIAAAGSGKTEEIVNRALALPASASILLTTYTSNGPDELRDRVEAKCGRIPQNITILPWLSFLLHHGARPYQAHLLDVNEIDGIYFDSREAAIKSAGWRAPKSNTRAYYLNGGRVYRDVLADLVVELNKK